MRIMLRELRRQFKTVAGQVEQITVFLRMAQSMHPPPSPPQDDSLLTDRYTSTSHGVGISLDPPAFDPHTSVVADPSLKPLEAHTIFGQQIVGGSMTVSTEPHDDLPAKLTNPPRPQGFMDWRE